MENADSARVELGTLHSRPGWAEQEAAQWWRSVTESCALLASEHADDLSSVSAVGFSAARETFVPVRPDGSPLGMGMLWSDRRAAAEALEVAERFGAEALRQRTGTVLDAGSMAAKLLWLARNEPNRIAEARWLLAPRDLVVLHMTGEVATDTTMATRTGLYDMDGEPAGEIVRAIVPEVGYRLPPVVASTSVVGTLRREAAADLHLTPGIPVVIGAGDRPCEVLGTGATAEEPMVSWGTTANASIPVDPAPQPVPSGLSLSAGAAGGHLLEAGLSASGQALSWLSGITKRSVSDLSEAAAATEPGAAGLLALPWLNGARAPWWVPAARGAFVGLTPAHDAGHMARSLYEAVAYEVHRGLTAMGVLPVGATALRLAGAGALSSVWVEVLSAVTGLSAALSRSGEGASAGACLLAAHGAGEEVSVERINPVTARFQPDPTLEERYRELRVVADRAAHAVLGLGNANR